MHLAVMVPRDRCLHLVTCKRRMLVLSSQPCFPQPPHPHHQSGAYALCVHSLQFTHTHAHTRTHTHTHTIQTTEKQTTCKTFYRYNDDIHSTHTTQLHKRHARAKLQTEQSPSSWDCRSRTRTCRELVSQGATQSSLAARLPRKDRKQRASNERSNRLSETEIGRSKLTPALLSHTMIYTQTSARRAKLPSNKLLKLQSS